MQQKNELTGKPALMKELNMGLITDALEQYQKMTRVELAAVTQISQPTVNMLIRQMLEDKTVISLGEAKSTGGRKAEVFALNHKRSEIASFIVRESCFEYIVTDLELNEEASGRVEREEDQSFLDQLCQMIRNIREEHRHIDAVTVGVPGAVSEEGNVFAIPVIPEWEGINLKQALEREFSLPVMVINDINAIAVGYSYCCQDGTKNLVYLHAGSTGIGAGIMIDGKLYPGCKSFAGEVGYMQLGEELVRAECKMGDPGRDIHRIVLLEKMVANIICVLNPEKIVIGGGDISTELFAHIREGGLKCLPEDILPDFVIIEGSGTDYYFKGLGKSGKELLDQNIRLA